MLVACSPHLAPSAQIRMAELHVRGSSDVVSSRVSAALASRPDLDEQAAELLLGSKYPTTRERAIMRVRDPRTLGEVMSGRSGSRALAALASNTYTDAGILSALAVHSNPVVVLRAVSNVSTPEAVRRSALSDLGRAASLVDRRSPVGAGVVRAGELVLGNRWLLEVAEALPPVLLRGLSCLPECPADILRKSAGRWASAADHPARSGAVVPLMTDEELAGNSSAAAHVELLSRPSFTAAGAAVILAASSRAGGHPLGRPLHPEPHVVARVFRRFGAEPLLYGRHAYLAGTRVFTSAWAEPFAGEVLNLSQGLVASGVSVMAAFASARSAAATLGDGSAAWSTFVPLAARHMDEVEQLEDAARVSLVLSQ